MAMGIGEPLPWWAIEAVCHGINRPAKPRMIEATSHHRKKLRPLREQMMTTLSAITNATVGNV
jgi:hypothetical protein